MATEAATLAGDEPVTELFELAQTGHGIEVRKPSPEKIARAGQIGKDAVDGGGAGANASDVAGGIGFDINGCARAMLMVHAGSRAQIDSFLTRLKTHVLLCAASNGPIAPATTEAAIAIKEQPALWLCGIGHDRV